METPRSPDGSDLRKTPPRSPRKRRPYAAPRLVEHGDFHRITRNIGLKNTDGLTGSKIS
jgi:hypothetical protein